MTATVRERRTSAVVDVHQAMRRARAMRAAWLAQALRRLFRRLKDELRPAHRPARPARAI